MEYLAVRPEAFSGSIIVTDVAPVSVEQAARIVGVAFLQGAPSSTRARLRDLGHFGRWVWLDKRASWPAVVVARLAELDAATQADVLGRWDAHMRLRQRFRRSTRRRRLGSVGLALAGYKTLGWEVASAPTAARDGEPTPEWLRADTAA